MLNILELMLRFPWRSVSLVYYFSFYNKWGKCYVSQKYVINLWMLNLIVQDKSEKLQVCAYVWSNPNDPNLNAEWDFEVSNHAIFLISIFSSQNQYNSQMFWGQKRNIKWPSKFKHIYSSSYAGNISSWCQLICGRGLCWLWLLVIAFKVWSCGRGDGCSFFTIFGIVRNCEQMQLMWPQFQLLCVHGDPKYLDNVSTITFGNFF